MRHGGVDISTELQLHSLHAGDPAPCCSNCLRRPLPGEHMHFYEADRTLCTLCAADTSETPQRSERIYATKRQLAVVPRAA